MFTSRIYWLTDVVDDIDLIGVSLVLVVVTASSFNDYQKEKQFRQLNAKKEDRLIEAIREGQQMRVSIYDICVGDVLLLATGDVICADGVLIEGYSMLLLSFLLRNSGPY